MAVAFAPPRRYSAARMPSADQDIVAAALKLYQQGELEKAARQCEDVLARDPKNLGALQVLAAVRMAEGKAEEAVTLIKRAIEAAPQAPGSHNNLGAMLLKQGRRDEALQSFDRAVALKPDFAEALNGRGNALRELGRAEEAVASYDKAIAARPGYVNALANRGDALGDLKRHAESLACYDKVLAAAPDYAEAHCCRGNALYALNRLGEAVVAFERALKLKPDHAGALAGMATAYADQGRRADALDCYRKALALQPNLAEARWRACMHTIPIMAGTGEDFPSWPTEFSRALTELESWLAANRDDDRELVGKAQPFYLAYQERNNRDLLARYGALSAGLMRQWGEKRGLPKPAVKSVGKLRVGVASAYFLDHSVWNAIVKGWFQHLNREKIELHGFHLSPRFDFETAWAKTKAISLAEGVRTTGQWAEAIAAARLDALIYPEIGMDPMVARLAGLRLARVQAACWGHPETTGLPTIDYYISAAGLEPPDAQANYTEKLVALPRLGCCYSTLAAKGAEPDLAALGIAGDAPMLLCPGMPFKYAPRNDGVFVAIARKLGKCQFVFFVDPKRRELSEKLRLRLAHVFKQAGMDFARYGVFAPWQNRAAFHGLMQRADVFLDTIGFSGFNTAAQALECGLPVVTQEGRFMRGRFASGILRHIGIPELIAADDEAYAAFAVRLASESEYRAAMKSRIALSRGKMFDDVGAVRALEDFLVEACGRA